MFGQTSNAPLKHFLVGGFSPTPLKNDGVTVGMMIYSQLFMESLIRFHGSIIDYYIPLYPIKNTIIIAMVPVTTNQLWTQIPGDEHQSPQDIPSGYD